MTDKQGTEHQRRATEFNLSPAIGTSLCPFKGPQIAIVPVRYALDRSHHDADPEIRKPLLKTGNWPNLPKLQSRDYTLRQLADGYVYVFDETAGTLHEYAYSAHDAGLTRIVWTDAQLGQDLREASGTDSARPYLLYPRRNTLHIAYAPLQWTWRLCEHMRSHADSRAQWMKRLDLASYCISMREPGTLPLTELANAVADIDPGQISHDQRFADSAIPASQPSADADTPANDETKASCNRHWVKVGADVHWLGSVPDKNSALLIALDDPLAILNDLGMQLAADQVMYQTWQAEHEHRLEIARLVTRLCGVPDEPKDSLPEAVRGDPAKTHAYLLDLEAFLQQYELEERIKAENAMVAPETSFVTTHKSDELREAFQKKHQVKPNPQQIQAWMERKKWRREVDMTAARTFLLNQQPEQQRLLQHIQDSRSDLQRWAARIGTEPLALFMDTGNPKTLLYLQTQMVELLTILNQERQISIWLNKQEKHATTLFGTLRYGFSPALKDALHSEADKLLNGLNDFTNLGTRAGELNTVLNHPGFAEAAWMKALKQPVQDTFKALRTLASGIGQQTAEAILLAFTAADSRLATGKAQDLTTLLRHLLIGQVLTHSQFRLAIDADIAERVRDWKAQRADLHKQLQGLRNAWMRPSERGMRRRLSLQITEQQARLRAHEATLPQLIDYQNNRYARQFQADMRTFIKSTQLTASRWQEHAKTWARQMGAHGVSIGWGVIMLNFINSAMVWEEVSRDGSLSEKDLAKVGYSLGWSFNLLMALYAEVPWAVVKNAQPVVIDGRSVSILDRSAAYWKAKGNPVWAEAARNFRVRLLATGLFAIGAAWLESWDLSVDLEQAKTTEEKHLIKVKIASVLIMGVGGFLQLLTLAKIIPMAWAMGSGFAITLLIAGIIYLTSTMLINELKQDGIGSWLRKCSWSHSIEYRYPDTVAGHEEELHALRQIELSPQVMVKATFEINYVYIGKSHTPIENNNGAWVQIRIPSALRDNCIFFDVAISKRKAGVLWAEKTEACVKKIFLDQGVYKHPDEWGKLDNKRPLTTSTDWHFSPVLQEGEDIIWETWVPVQKDDDYLELQIWYPTSILKATPLDTSYLYQIPLKHQGESSVDGLEITELPIKSDSREGAWQLFWIT